MSLRVRFRFDGKCSIHPRYNPEKDGRPEHKDCSGCESIWVIHLYVAIARRKADAGEGIFVSGPVPAVAGATPIATEEYPSDVREEPQGEDDIAAAE